MTQDKHQDANAWLLSGGAKSATFHNIGDLVSGTVVDFEMKQQTDFNSGKPLVWDDGNPRMQLVVTLDTGIIDGDADDDDGRRGLYAKGQMFTALRKAVAPFGGIKVGGELAVQYVGNGKQESKGKNPPKIYEVTYTPPVKTMRLDAMAEDDDEDDAPRPSFRERTGEPKWWPQFVATMREFGVTGNDIAGYLGVAFSSDAIVAHLAANKGVTGKSIIEAAALAKGAGGDPDDLPFE